MAEDVTEFCAEYAKKRDIVFADSTFFFPAPEGTCYSSEWLRHLFLALWAKAFPDKKDCGVRVYDLRHRFATTIMTAAIERGENLYAFIPNMSAYMGHTSYRDTIYYIHLLPEHLRNSANFDYEQFAKYFPEVPENE